MWKGIRDFMAPIKKITGFSTPFGGVSWQAQTSEREAIRELVVFLEERTTLYPNERPKLSNSFESLAKTREKLTETITAVGEGSRSEPYLRQMRLIVTNFLQHQAKFPNPEGQDPAQSPELREGFAEMRGALGANVQVLVSIYDLDVESCLAALFTDEGEKAPPTAG